MPYIDTLKRFVFNAFLLDDSLSRLEKDGISVSSGASVIPVERIEESDFSPKIIYNANKMSSVYVAFFCLENSVRDLISERLLERHKIDWWDKQVPEKIKTAVVKLKESEEKNRYHSARSTTLIGYTMFGNLAQIIISNWEDFSDLFPTQAWITSRFLDLEMSRNIIMHTGTLPEIEIERIESIVRDWVRQVG
jgi:hypothetical protein